MKTELIQYTLLFIIQKCKVLFNLQEDYLFNLLEKTMSGENAKIIADKFCNQIINRLCINHLSVCCPNKHFGPKCRPCSVSTDGHVCSGNGHCKGEGTRKGSGKCVCSAGYEGDLCDLCSNGYFLAKFENKDTDKHSKKVTCSACDVSCENGCAAAGPNNCRACRKGYLNDSDYGCLDINECLGQEHLCGKGTFCVNTEGSHYCYGKHAVHKNISQTSVLQTILIEFEQPFLCSSFRM